MIVIPAIDLKDHKVVRLAQGRMGEARIYSDDPMAIAKKWVDAHATRIHLVDLNGAFEGKPIHFDDVARICRAFPGVQFEIGGGIRNLEAISKYFDSGAAFCILGTAAIKEPALVSVACKKYPGKIILGLDAIKGRVAVEGWEKVTDGRAELLAKQFAGKEIAAIIYTDITRDGMMSGVNLAEMRRMAQKSPVPIIASGGVSQLSDIENLAKIPNVIGVIVGKALYEGKIDLKEAIRLTYLRTSDSRTVLC